jgi:hypothetical protein
MDRPRLDHSHSRVRRCDVRHAKDVGVTESPQEEDR